MNKNGLLFCESFIRQPVFLFQNIFANCRFFLVFQLPL